jgi:Asp-tRNA(Asn)/Glu-tRNA(Gln) amidotransferase A subunit family amidase
MPESSAADLPIEELTAAYRRREVSPVAVVAEVLDRIEKWDGQLHAYVVVDRDGAIEQARQAERAYAAGSPRGPLDGIPISIKDAFHVRGLPSTLGSVAHRNVVSRSDSGVVKRLRRAGSIIVGKTNAAEFGQSATSDNLLGPDTVNPWGRGLTPGGSSGGAAVSVAAGMAMAAIGSDGGGSIRIPAAFTGLVGMKPTYGLVRDEKGFRGMTDFAVAGPLTRTVSDARFVLEVMAEREFARRENSRPLRIAYVSQPEARPVDPRIRAALDDVAHLLTGLGCSVIDMDVPLTGWQEVFGPLVLDDENRERGHLLDLCPESLTKYELGSLRAARALAPADVERAEALLPKYRSRLDDFLHQVDLILTPTVATPAFPLGQRPRTIDGTPVDWLWGAFPFTVPFNVAGVPAISIPCGLADGLPIGAQLVAASGSDALVMAVAEELEAAIGHVFVPPVLDITRAL